MEYLQREEIMVCIQKGLSDEEEAAALALLTYHHHLSLGPAAQNSHKYTLLLLSWRVSVGQTRQSGLGIAVEPTIKLKVPATSREQHNYEPQNVAGIMYRQVNN